MKDWRRGWRQANVGLLIPAAVVTADVGAVGGWCWCADAADTDAAAAGADAVLLLMLCVRP